jgi:hypothetical protein
MVGILQRNKRLMPMGVVCKWLALGSACVFPTQRAARVHASAISFSNDEVTQ